MISDAFLGPRTEMRKYGSSTESAGVRGAVSDAACSVCNVRCTLVGAGVFGGRAAAIAISANDANPVARARVVEGIGRCPLARG